jgi:hypothetical protein
MTIQEVKNRLDQVFEEENEPLVQEVEGCDVSCNSLAVQILSELKKEFALQPYHTFRLAYRIITLTDPGSYQSRNYANKAGIFITFPLPDGLSKNDYEELMPWERLVIGTDFRDRLCEEIERIWEAEEDRGDDLIYTMNIDRKYSEVGEWTVSKREYDWYNETVSCYRPPSSSYLRFHNVGSTTVNILAWLCCFPLLCCSNIESSLIEDKLFSRNRLQIGIKTTVCRS